MRHTSFSWVVGFCLAVGLSGCAGTTVPARPVETNAALGKVVVYRNGVAYFERYARELAPDWALARDLYLVKNIFPEAVKEKAAQEGLVLPD